VHQNCDRQAGRAHDRCFGAFPEGRSRVSLRFADHGGRTAFGGAQLLHAIVNDIDNRKERRRYAEEVQQYRVDVQVYEATLLAWQDRHYRVHGWVPQLPPIPRF
jgi:hypothetical protein